MHVLQIKSLFCRQNQIIININMQILSQKFFYPRGLNQKHVMKSNPLFDGAQFLFPVRRYF